VQYKSILAMIFNEIKCHVNTSLGLVAGDAGDASPLCPRLLTYYFNFAHDGNKW